MAIKILIVEDEAIVAMSLSRALPRLGYEICRVFASGEEAVEAVNVDCPHVVLMDIHLVGVLDGIQAAEQIRQRHNVPIVFMSGYDIGEIQDRTHHLTNIAYVGKPVGTQRLDQVIRELVQPTS